MSTVRRLTFISIADHPRVEVKSVLIAVSPFIIRLFWTLFFNDVNKPGWDTAWLEVSLNFINLHHRKAENVHAFALHTNEIITVKTKCTKTVWRDMTGTFTNFITTQKHYFNAWQNLCQKASEFFFYFSLNMEIER